MKRVVILSVMPLLGALLIGLSARLNLEQLRLRITGVKTAGHLAAMAVVRSGTSDLITSIATEIVMTPATGTPVHVEYLDFELKKTWRMANDGSMLALPTNEIPAAVAVVMETAARGNAEMLRWLLMREGRRAHDSGRIVRIEKQETARGYFDMARMGETIDCTSGKLRPARETGDMPAPGAVMTHAVFDTTDTAQVQSNKGDTLVSYVQVRNGETNSPDKKNFVLYCEPYTTEFRPVFTYEAQGQQYARMSHIGRHGGPTLALVLYGPCWVYYDHAAPQDAVLIANPGTVNGDVLGWFSRLCEGAFAQWGSGALIVLVGIFFILLGVIEITLAVWPSTRLV